MVIYFLNMAEKNTIQKLNMTFSERYQILSGGLNLFVTYVVTACSSSKPEG
jgi:hypothetical protein